VNHIRLLTEEGRGGVDELQKQLQVLTIRFRLFKHLF
jgi:hypothetical protein